MEEWRSILKCPGYEVSSLGNVRRILKTGKTKQLRPHYVQQGYQKLNLRVDGHEVKRRIHRLVAEAFVDGKTFESDIVDHINGDRSDNRAINLRWVNTLQNQGNKNQFLKRLVEQVCSLRDNGKSPEEILRAII